MLSAGKGLHGSSSLLTPTLLVLAKAAYAECESAAPALLFAALALTCCMPAIYAKSTRVCDTTAAAAPATATATFRAVQRTLAAIAAPAPRAAAAVASKPTDTAQPVDAAATKPCCCDAAGV